MDFIKTLLCTMIPSFFAGLASQSTSTFRAHGIGLRQAGVSLVPIIIGIAVTAALVIGALGMVDSLTKQADNDKLMAEALQQVLMVKDWAADNTSSGSRQFLTNLIDEGDIGGTTNQIGGAVDEGTHVDGVKGTGYAEFTSVMHNEDHCKSLIRGFSGLPGVTYASCGGTDKKVMTFRVDP